MNYQKQYANRINWKNSPDTSTPLNATNLNKMDKAINYIDAKLYEAINGGIVDANPSGTATGSLNKIEINGTVYGIPGGGSYTAGNGISISNSVITNIRKGALTGVVDSISGNIAHTQITGARDTFVAGALILLQSEAAGTADNLRIQYGAQSSESQTFAIYDTSSTAASVTIASGDTVIMMIDNTGYRAIILNVLSASGGSSYAGLGIGKKTGVSSNVIDTDIDLHRAPIVGDRLLIYFDEKVTNPTGLITYNNGTAVTSGLENAIPLYINAGWNILEYQDNLLVTGWMRVKNVPLPISTLSGLTDTAITTPSDDQLLVYDNGKWKNKKFIEANVGFPVTELRKIEVDGIVYDTDGMRTYEASNVDNDKISLSVINAYQFVQKVIAINIGAHSGSSNGWSLYISDGMEVANVALTRADGSAFDDDIHENELLFVYVDTAGNVARVLEIHSHDLEVLKDICITEKTVSGNPVTVTDALPYLAENVVAEITPIQDLHGYDKPWVGGAGKNLLPMTVEGIKATNSGYTWSGNSCTVSGITFTILTDSNGNVTGINVDGTATAQITFFITKTVQYTSGTSYILDGCPSGGSLSSYLFYIVDNGEQYDTGSGVSFISSGSANRLVLIMVRSGITISNKVFYPMIRLSTASAGFEPYSNICPISGRTAVDVDDLPNADYAPFFEGVKNGTYGFVDLGSLTWTYTSGNNSRMSATLSGAKGAVDAETFNGICKKYVSTTINNVYYHSTTDKVIGIKSNGTIMIRDDSFTDAATFKTAMNGVYLIYELATPTTPSYTDAQWKTLVNSFGGNDATISFGQTVYGGTLNLTTGVLTVTHAIVDLGSLSWYKDTTTRPVDGATIHAFYAGISAMKVVGGTDIGNIICSQYVADAVQIVDYGGKEVVKDGLIGGADNNNRIWVYDSRYNEYSTANFKTAMSGVQAVYELATPTTTTLTAEQLALVKGQNTLTCNSGNMEITYKASGLDALKERVDELEDAVADLETDLASKAEKTTIGTVESGTTASQPYAVGEHFIRNDKFCTCISAIASGATLTQGTNYVEGTIAEALTYKDNYSTNETVIGTWKGQPLYRKVVEFGALPNINTKTVSSGLTNVVMRKIYGIGYLSSGATAPLPFIGGASNTMIVLSCDASLNIMITTGEDRSSWTADIIIEYTKNS